MLIDPAMLIIKSPQFFKYRPLARPRFVNFTTKGIDDLERSITAVWTAKIERSINEELEISFVGYQYNKIATIKLVSGKVYYRVDNGLRLLGDMADNEIHTVVWKINPIAQTHSLIISGGGTAIELQDEPIQTSAIAYLQNDQKSISMIYPGEDSGAINYTISKLRIAYSDEDEEEQLVLRQSNLATCHEADTA